MNQIPNIIDEIVKDMQEKLDLDCWSPECDCSGGEKVEAWLRTTLHQQLQKAREEEKERCIKVVEDYGKSMSKHHNQMIGTAHEDSKMMLAFDAHSRLIAVKHITEKMNHSELDQDIIK